tara:strand:+ start:5471 stop:5755 length:285 start_codon:yes stop_codon:yes gene_type:complete
MSISSVERQLRRTSQQISRLRDELLLLEEQYAHFSDEAETARIHALVSETPISERTHQRAARHADVVGQERNQLMIRIGQLEGTQDLLLDQMNS